MTDDPVQQEQGSAKPIATDDGVKSLRPTVVIPPNEGKKPGGGERVSFTGVLVVLALLIFANAFPPTSLFVLETETNRVKYKVGDHGTGAELVVAVSRVIADGALVSLDTHENQNNGSASTNDCQTVTIIPAAGSFVTIEILHEQTLINVSNPSMAVAATIKIGSNNRKTIENKIGVALSFECSESGFARGGVLALHGEDIQLGTPIIDADLDFANLRRTPGEDLRIQARGKGGFVSGTIQAYSKSMFCRDYGVVSLAGDCSIYATFNEPMSIPPGASMAPERFRAGDKTWIERGFEYAYSLLVSQNRTNNKGAVFLGAVQFQEAGLVANISADADLVRLFYPSVEGLSIGTPAFKITWFEQIMVEPVLGFALAILLGGGSPILGRYFGSSFNLIRNSRFVGAISRTANAAIWAWTALKSKLCDRKAKSQVPRNADED